MKENDKLNQTTSAAEKATDATRTTFEEYLLTMPSENLEAFGSWAEDLKGIKGPDDLTMGDLYDNLQDDPFIVFDAVRKDYEAGKIGAREAFYKLAFYRQSICFDIRGSELLEQQAMFSLSKALLEHTQELSRQLEMCADYAYDNKDDPTEFNKANKIMSELITEIAECSTEKGREKFLQDRALKLLSSVIGTITGHFS